MWRRYVQTAGGPSPVRSDVVSITESNLNSWALPFDHFWPLRLPPTSTCCWGRTGCPGSWGHEDRYRRHFDRGCPKPRLSYPKNRNSLDSYAYRPGCLGTCSSKTPAKSKTENNNGRAGGPSRDLPYREPLPGPRIGGTGERKRKALGGGSMGLRSELRTTDKLPRPLPPQRKIESKPPPLFPLQISLSVSLVPPFGAPSMDLDSTAPRKEQLLLNRLQGPRL